MKSCQSANRVLSSTQFSEVDWVISVQFLCYEIARLKYKSNLLSDAAAAKGEFFFSDFGVPRPRPTTALAWASLCAFGPIQGYHGVKPGSSDDEYIQYPFNLTQGKFLLPFLPKFLMAEEQN